MRRRALGPVLVFLSLYATFASPLWLWPAGDVLSFVSSLLYALLATGLAIRTTELVFAFAWKPAPLKQCAGIDAPGNVANVASVAIVMTVCDDHDPTALRALAGLAAAGFDAFVLDDSSTPVDLPSECGDLNYVRRDHRRGAKAANLNHWLRQYGDRYESLVLLDADSVMPQSTVDALVRVAAHPDNARIAIFQAKIAARTEGQSVFGRAVSAHSGARTSILDRVHRPLGLMMSAGHNQLVRLAPVKALGGFPEFVSCEDTALSLMLASIGWRIELVDAWSYDAEPHDVRTFNRRTIRWARQTVEVFHYGWHDTPLRLKLLMSWHVLAHASPVIGTMLFVLSLWSGPDRIEDVAALLGAALTLAEGFALYGLVLWVALAIAALIETARTTLARREGASWSTLALAAIVGAAHVPSLILPLTLGMLASACGQRARFNPTNSRRTRARDHAAAHRLARGLSAATIISVPIAGAIAHPGSILIGFNVIWLTALIASPLALYLLERSGLQGSTRR